MNYKKRLICAVCLLSAFVIFTALVCCVDVKAVGADNTNVGFAGLNMYVHRLTGVHLGLYYLTDWLSLVPLGAVPFFAAVGLIQWIRRKSLLKVDRSLLALGALYVLAGAVYLLFESFAINYRPILIDGALESSYPSSTTLLVLCVVPFSASYIAAHARMWRPCATSSRITAMGRPAIMQVWRKGNGLPIRTVFSMIELP